MTLEGVLGAVSVGTTSGDIEATRLSGATFRASTQSGDVQVTHATNPAVNIETVSGDIAVEKTTGRTLRTRTVSGDIAVTETATEADVTLDTVSGSLEYAPKSPLGGGTVKLSAVSGDIAARLPRDTNAVLDLSSKGGDVEADLYPAPAEGGAGAATEKSLRVSGMVSVSETLGTGAGARIMVGTVSGDIHVEQAAQ